MKNNLLNKIDKNRMQADLDYLCQLDRTSGTPGEQSAIDYVVEQMKEAGLEIKVHEFDAYLSYPLYSSVKLINGSEEVLKARTRAFSGTTPDDGIVGQLVHVPGGSNMFKDYNTKNLLESVDLKGKIVISEGGGRQNMIAAQRLGAVGYIHMWPSSEEVIHEGIVTPVWGTPTPETVNNIPEIPVVSITNCDGKKLLSLINNDEQAAVRLISKTDTNWRRLRMPEGIISGSSNNFVLVGGHIDSWYLGATDNASGNASMLEIARVLADHEQLNRGVRFVMWVGHSTGRYAGSTWYADHYWQTLNENCVAYINIDSPGSQGATDYSLITASSETSQLGIEVVEKITGQRPKWERPVRAGDQSFWGAGISSLYMLLSARPEAQRSDVGGSGYGWWWHTPFDTRDKIDDKILVQDTKIHLLSLFKLCQETFLPLDLYAAIEELETICSFIQKKCENHLDLSPIFESLQDLKQSTITFNNACDLIKNEKTVDKNIVDEVNSTLIKTLHVLTPINYTVKGKYDHDPAIAQKPLPALQPACELADLALNDKNAYNLSKTQLQRNINRIVSGLRRANEILLQSSVLDYKN